MSVFFTFLVLDILRKFLKHFSSKVPIFFLCDWEISHGSRPFVASGKLHALRILIVVCSLKSDMLNSRSEKMISSGDDYRQRNQVFR